MYSVDELLLSRKCFKLLTFILLCIALSSIQLNFNYVNVVNVKNPLKIEVELDWEATNLPIAHNRFVLNINGCTIPELRYLQTDVRGSLSDCGTRQIYLNKISDDTGQFEFRDHFSYCCYLYVKRSTKVDREEVDVTYTNCKPFQNGTVFNVSDEVIQVKCKNYNDLFTFVLKKNIHQKIPRNNNTKHWNVLVLGIDSFSRIRSLTELKKTTTYIRKRGWLDFRGYNKIGDNTYPNLISMMTNMSAHGFNKSCFPRADKCKKHLIWNRFREAGYSTSFVEDATFMKSIFNRVYGLRTPPADHYIRHLFLQGEKGQKHLLTRPVTCAGKISEGEQILNYVSDYVKTYKDEKFFGFFWMSSFSHGSEQSMKIIDQHFMETIKYITNISKNTFLFLLSDHGKRYGRAMLPIESYYDSRLPAFFLMVPKDFKVKYPEKYSTLKTNQKRLISSPDIHLTLNDILSLSTTGKASKENYFHHHCKHCRSLFQVLSENRKCIEAGIPKFYCACHDIEEGWVNEAQSQVVQIKAKQSIERKVRQTVFVKKNQYCLNLELVETFRVHRYTYDGYLYYILGVIFAPKPNDENINFRYELIAKVYNDQKVHFIAHLPLDSYYQNPHRFCCTQITHCFYCVCQSNKTRLGS